MLFCLDITEIPILIIVFNASHPVFPQLRKEALIACYRLVHSWSVRCNAFFRPGPYLCGAESQNQAEHHTNKAQGRNKALQRTDHQFYLSLEFNILNT